MTGGGGEGGWEKEDKMISEICVKYGNTENAPPVPASIQS